MANLLEGKTGLVGAVCFILLVSQALSSGLEEQDGLFEGDLKIPKLQNASKDPAEFQMVLAASRFGRWPGAVMPYVIASTIGSSNERKILAAMAEWKAKTCVKFVRRSTQRDYVEFISNSGGCWSNGIGRNANGKQQINLNKPCFGHGTILHEIGHALGFWHEQSRPDRDNYVLIKTENIRPGMESQFQKYTHGRIDSLGVLYDYGSVMHYPRWAFSRNGRDTIVPIQSGVVIGQRVRLSARDAQQANLMYECLSTTSLPQKTTATTEPAQNKSIAPEGYIMHVQSEKCFYPVGGVVSGETHPIVLSKCDKHIGRFRMYADGIFQHVSSGMCIQPTGNCASPADNAELVLSKSCTGRDRMFVINLDGILIHSSKTCARPAHGSVAVPDGTRVVVHRFCTASKFSFAFIALPRTDEKNLALGKVARQISTFDKRVASLAVDGKRDGDYYKGSCSHTLPSRKPWWLLDFGKEERVGIVYISNRADCCWSRLSGFEIRIGNILSLSKNPRCGIKYSLKRGETREIVCKPSLSGRYVIISIQNSRGAYLSLCEVAVYAPSEDLKMKTPKPDLTGLLQHSQSKLCVLPKYKKVVNNSVVVLTAKCTEPAARFRSLADSSLQHVDSGMCLAPKDGCVTSLVNDTEVVLIDRCGVKATKFTFTESGSLMHVSSKACVRSSSYPVSNEATTLVVLTAQCDPKMDKFEYVTVPKPTSTSIPVGNAQCGRVKSKSALVIGGKTAQPGAWPWQVALKQFGRFICGGSLIKPDWVVTAAHCVNDRRRYSVVLGEHDRTIKESSEIEIVVKRTIAHPKFNKPYPINNDIALLQLETPVELGSRINTVCLPPQDYDVPPITSKCFITGWGKIRHPGGSYLLLQQAEMPPVSNAACREKLKKTVGSSSALTITDQMICGGKEGSVISGCHGDSGGPYVCVDKSGRWFLQGVVSWGSPQCRAADRYTVFARVAKFRQWIDDEISQVTN